MTIKYPDIKYADYDVPDYLVHDYVPDLANINFADHQVFNTETLLGIREESPYPRDSRHWLIVYKDSRPWRCQLDFHDVAGRRFAVPFGLDRPPKGLNLSELSRFYPQAHVVTGLQQLEGDRDMWQDPGFIRQVMDLIIIKTQVVYPSIAYLSREDFLHFCPSQLPVDMHQAVRLKDKCISDYAQTHGGRLKT